MTILSAVTRKNVYVCVGIQLLTRMHVALSARTQTFSVSC